MSLDTIIHAGLTHSPQPTTALVLMGGGARTAYQVGVLRALGTILRAGSQPVSRFPFKLVIGTSAGAINGVCLAACAMQGLQAFDQLAAFWSNLRSSDVYRLTMPSWARFSKVMAAYSLSRQARLKGAILDSTPLQDTLTQAISLGGLEASLAMRAIDAVAVTASNYTTGVHWTFCHTAADDPMRGWSRPGRRAEFQSIGIDHLMASSAIPFLFPSGPLKVNGRDEYFGDGSMRQASPLSPALHLGAKKILVVGVGQPQRAGLAVQSGAPPTRGPTLGGIAGHAMASVFHDTLQADVEQTQRVTNTMRNLPPELASALPYRRVEVLAIQPTESLDAMAHHHVKELPLATRHALAGLGILRGSGGALASYLLFEPGFVQALMAMGESDAYARKAELLAFFSAA